MTETMYETIRVQRQPGRKLSAKGLVEIGASLADIDWRLLHWLLRYPLRSDDLLGHPSVSGVSSWEVWRIVLQSPRIAQRAC